MDSGVFKPLYIINKLTYLWIACICFKYAIKNQRCEEGIDDIILAKFDDCGRWSMGTEDAFYYSTIVYV